MSYAPTIGLEIHVELKTKSKMFCDSANGFGLEQEPNVNVCPVCMGHPGTLPVINKEAVKKVIEVGLALNCQIADITRFDRKNYFYPDLPKGYQISQYEKPISQRGFLEIGDKRIRIARIHLEEDTGKLVHPKGVDYSLVDFNRAGVPLMELVTEPDISSGKDARQFCEQLQLILRYLDISDADMEKGQMRCEVNISVKKQKTKNKNQSLGTKVEIKNLNSFRSVEKSIDYEIKRQSELLENGGKVVQETRGFNDAEQITFSQRIKEEAHDYRYFPEPDLPPLVLGELIREAESKMTELPQGRRARFASEYKLPAADIEVFTQNKFLGDYFEKTISELEGWEKSEDIADKKGRLIKLAANYLITELQKLLKDSDTIVQNLKITPENFAEFIILTQKEEVSSSGAQVLLAEMFKTGADPSQIIELKNMRQISDTSELEKIARDVILQNPGPVADFKAGKQQALQFLVGKVMASSRGKANPQLAGEILRQLLTK